MLEGRFMVAFCRPKPWEVQASYAYRMRRDPASLSHSASLSERPLAAWQATLVVVEQWCIRKAAAYLSVHRRACGQQPDFGRLRRSARSVCALFLATVRKPQIA